MGRRKKWKILPLFQFLGLIIHRPKGQKTLKMKITFKISESFEQIIYQITHDYPDEFYKIMKMAATIDPKPMNKLIENE